MNLYSNTWKKSRQPRKQRKYRYLAPFHVLTKFLSATLNKDLRKKHGMRSIPLRNGDKVKVLRGQHKGKTGSITQVNRKKSKVFIGGIERTKTDGNKSFIPLDPSNLMITDLNLQDKRRIKKKEEKKIAKETPQKT